uniref:Peptidase A1 domain-containing protein n=1 Tax=Ananas comosus var. bracteatus TaxID=296719 RepID=A0A6V7QNV0_ANACO|nr:unnamed protein product [Ananas comosus var. bracteatus]
MVVDSGTTFTMLPDETHSSSPPSSAAKCPAPGSPARPGPSPEPGSARATATAPTGTRPRPVPRPGPPLQGATPAWRCRGGTTSWGSRARARKRGWSVGCLMVMNGGDESDDGYGGPAGTLGNFQQQGFEVVYDLEQGRVGVRARRCTALWDSLSRG